MKSKDVYGKSKVSSKNVFLSRRGMYAGEEAGSIATLNGKIMVK